MGSVASSEEYGETETSYRKEVYAESPPTTARKTPTGDQKYLRTNSNDQRSTLRSRLPGRNCSASVLGAAGFGKPWLSDPLMEPIRKCSMRPNRESSFSS